MAKGSNTIKTEKLSQVKLVLASGEEQIQLMNLSTEKLMIWIVGKSKSANAKTAFHLCIF